MNAAGGHRVQIFGDGNERRDAIDRVASQTRFEPRRLRLSLMQEMREFGQRHAVAHIGAPSQRGQREARLRRSE